METWNGGAVNGVVATCLEPHFDTVQSLFPSTPPEEGSILRWTGHADRWALRRIKLSMVADGRWTMDNGWFAPQSNMHNTNNSVQYESFFIVIIT